MEIIAPDDMVHPIDFDDARVVLIVGIGRIPLLINKGNGFIFKFKMDAVLASSNEEMGDPIRSFGTEDADERPLIGDDGGIEYPLLPRSGAAADDGVPFIAPNGVTASFRTLDVWEIRDRFHDAFLSFLQMEPRSI